MTDEVLVRAENLCKYFRVSGGRYLHAVETAPGGRGGDLLEVGKVGVLREVAGVVEPAVLQTAGQPRERGHRRECKHRLLHVILPFVFRMNLDRTTGISGLQEYSPRSRNSQFSIFNFP